MKKICVKCSTNPVVEGAKVCQSCLNKIKKKRGVKK